VAGSCEHGDEPSGSGATELITKKDITQLHVPVSQILTGSHRGYDSCSAMYYMYTTGLH
jgi:hypothetical protein